MPVPRIDLTPMVDLGFLLITFFMFTTTLAQQKALKINMPSKEVAETPPVIPEESTITVLLGSAHQISYYTGASLAAENVHDTSLAGLSNVIAARKSVCAGFPSTMSGEAHKLHVLIKPTDDCRYEDVVRVVDYMLIHQVPYYAITDPIADELELLSSRGRK